ncbi:hypothetical protein J3F83DRAFT_722180 [Trichoderma novae-zelandiae]
MNLMFWEWLPFSAPRKAQGRIRRVFVKGGAQVFAITSSRDSRIFIMSTGAKILGLSLGLDPYDRQAAFHLAPGFPNRKLVVHEDMAFDQAQRLSFLGVWDFA